MASRVEGWELMEKTLLAAQRQEGLRQVILETVDEVHPEAFRRMLRLIRDHELARFSAVVRAANVWFGLQWDSVSVKTVNTTIDQVLTYLGDPKARSAALAGRDPEAIFLALWSIAFDDALAAIPVAEKLLKDKKTEVRFVAAVHLSQLALPQTWPVRAVAMEDEDLRVALCALDDQSFFYAADDGEESEGPEYVDDRFERVERLFQRLPVKPTVLKPLVWPWTERKASRELVAWHLVASLGKRPPTALIPYLPSIKSPHRGQVVRMLADQKKWDGLTRDTLIRLAGDATSDVRTAVCQSLAKIKLQPDEIEVLEGFLTRKSSDLRQGILGLLLKQSGAQALASADRLTASKDAQQRLAGLEILRQLAESKRGRDACQSRAAAYRTGRKKLSSEEQAQLDGITGASAEQVTLDNALGLMDPSKRSAAIAPKARKVAFVTKAAVACIEDLDRLIHEHRETTITYKRWDGEKQELLGNIKYGFPWPSWRKPPEKGRETLPLADVWEAWYTARPKSLRDKDALELVRAAAWLEVANGNWKWKQFTEGAKGSKERNDVLAALTCGFGPLKLNYPNLVDGLLAWLLYLHPPAGAVDFLLDATEASFALIPEADVRKLADLPDRKYYYDELDPDWRNVDTFELWCKRLDSHGSRLPDTLSPQQVRRRWQLMRWKDEPFAGARRQRPDFCVVASAYDESAATEADLLDHLIGPDQVSRYFAGGHFPSLERLTLRKPHKKSEAFLTRHPEVRELVEKCRARIVEIELARGETPTAATAPAWNLGSLWGTELLVQLMTTLGTQGFKIPFRLQEADKESKVCTLTRLVSITYPKSDETPEDFCRLIGPAVREGKITEQMVLQLAFLAPQWARHVESYLRWNGLAEALYWFLAHMQYATGREEAALGAGIDDEPQDAEKDDDDLDDQRRKPSAWERLVAERTPLSVQERYSGAVDVNWFRRIYAEVTPKRWQAMAETARFASNPAQARHAQFVADVLTGKARRKLLIDGIRKKKLKDYVRLLGLYPLAVGAKRDADLVERYNVLQEYRRYARGLSAMTKPEALRSVEIGMQNLASTAGYADPLRLEWALEAEQVKQLARGPLSAKKDGVTVTLALSDEAQPQVTIERAGKPLKSIPPGLKKDKRIAELWEQAAHLKRQASRMKSSLEMAMCRGDTFSGAELGQLSGHAILAPLLGRLVLVGDGIMGYPDRNGRALRDAHGKLEPVKKGESLRIAHAHDLFASGAWDQYQRECFQAERIQPFKQVFRELYVVTKQEKRDGTVSRRYAGQQVQPKQALALWGQRGWSSQEGVWKTFHDAGLIASVEFAYGGGTPLEVEGLTIEGVEFRRRDELKPLKLIDVPPRIFSEVMRDVDLVVSVAHRGGVDPEASASTVEMRSSLLRETCLLLGLKNVRIKEPHVLIDGQIGNYSVHLGSATVHRLPGGAVCLIAVPAQHRGRLFLPFTDDDPRTAEVISKTILLARDAKIQDPTILEQLRA
jgi:hypothetical protein